MLPSFAIHEPDSRGAASTHLDGYYDQSHFNRDFSTFIGVAPGEKISGRMPQGMTVTDHLLEGEFAGNSR